MKGVTRGQCLVCCKAPIAEYWPEALSTREKQGDVMFLHMAELNGGEGSVASTQTHVSSKNNILCCLLIIKVLCRLLDIVILAWLSQNPIHV